MIDKKDCAGCYDDFYNRPPHEGCWMRNSGKMTMRKRVHIRQRPPWLQKPERLPSCYHVPQHVFVRGDQVFCGGGLVEWERRFGRVSDG